MNTSPPSPTPPSSSATESATGSATRPPRHTDTDVVVLGSGIGGSAIAAILARQGARVAVVDGGYHPRFALGESTIGETSFLLRQLATRYDVPELAQVTTSHGLAKNVSRRCGIKRNFGFVYHRAGEVHDRYEVTQCNVSEGRYGPESHLLRADVDAYLFAAAQRYGAVAYEGTLAEGVDFAPEGGGATVRLRGGSVVSARYVIDATGRRSVLAEQLGLREEPCRLATDTRTIFAHMRGVRPYDEVEGGNGQPTPWHEGTLHHLFEGGWLWVIPFGNHADSETDLVSVGLTLERGAHPERPGATAAEEWAEFLARFPSIAEQFADAELAFEWVQTGRTQYSSRETVGDGWLLMSHAAGAVDALFSRGMANTFAVVEASVPILLAGLRDGDLSARRFAYVDRLNQTILDNNDRLIHGSYISFRDFDLWRAWSKMWYLAWNLGVIRYAGSYYRYLETGDAAELDLLHDAPFPGTFCPELESAQQQFERCYQLMLDVDAGRLTPLDAVPKLAWTLGDGEASPEPLNLFDVLRRWHDGSPETQRLIYDWGRSTAPEPLRKYFTYDRATVTRAADFVLAA